MNKIKSFTYILSIILFVVFLSSCGVTTTKLMRTGSFMPNDVRLNMTMDDFQYLGDAEVTAEYSKYFGFITVFKLINGKEVARRNSSIISLEGSGNFSLSLTLNSKLRRALFDVHIKYPNADFIVPVNIITESEGMFLGNVVKQKIKVKAYKIKDKQ
jgi:hypothetical protein